MKSKESKYFSLDGMVYYEDAQVPVIHITDYYETPVLDKNPSYSPTTDDRKYHARIWSFIGERDLHYTAVIKACDQIEMFEILKQNTANQRVIFSAKLLYRQKRPYEAFD